MDELENYLGRLKDGFENIPLRVKIVYVLSTSLMVFQHLSGWSWDFLVYSMNGEYMFQNGMFMEWLRPPVASFLLGLPQLLVSQPVAEVVFVIAVSTFFLYSALRVSRSYELNFTYFYLLLMMPATIFYGTVNGTEMLSLAFAMLFFAELQKSRTGVWLGLTFLTRYNYGALIPLVLVQRDLKKSVKTLLVSAVPVSLWLLYNYLETGHPLKSFANYLGLNVLRRSAHDPLNPINFLIIGLPVSIILLLYVKQRYRNLIDINSDQFIFMAGFAALSALLYAISGLKPLRYLYPMVLPVAFFATKVVQEFKTENMLGFEVTAQRVVEVVAALSLVSAAVLIFMNPLAPPANFQEAADSADGCMVQSNVWPMISYAGTPAISTTYQEDSEVIGQGYRIIDYGNSIYGNSTDLPVIESTPLYTTYGNETLCKEPEISDRSWMTGLNTKTGKNYTPETFLAHEVKTLVWK